METIGVGIIARNAGKTVKACIQSFAEHVDQIVVVLAGESTDNTKAEVQAASPKVEIFEIPWVDDFSAARNFSFSRLNTDWVLWVDADDEVYQAENLRKLIAEAIPEVGCLWFPYHYAIDEFGNVCTIYERERLLRAKSQWIWQGRLHETVSPLIQCQYARTDDVIIRHNHLAGESRHDRNFKILNIMYNEDPNEKRVWLYMGHQHFAARNWLVSSQWYMKFGQDTGATPIERYQALCYCAKAMREMKDPQAADVSLMAVELFPQYRDAYLELAQSYLMVGDYKKAIHWATLSEMKDVIVDTPHLIFVNPLDYSFNKFCMMSECYMKLGDYQKAIHYLVEAKNVRPVPDIDRNANYVRSLWDRERLINSIKSLAIHLLNNRELVKLSHLLDVVPYWFKDTEEFKQLQGGVAHYAQEIKTAPLPEAKDGQITIDITKVVEPEKILAELNYDKVRLEAPYQGEGHVNLYSQRDLEQIIMSKSGRHIINLRQEPDKIWAEYDNKVPQTLSLRMFLGQGLENWNPQSIKEVGCGGSETAAASICRELAKQDCQPILYAMDNQVWDGVIYRKFTDFKPDSLASHLFISSRVPEVFTTPIPAKQKWLWFHDVHRWNRFTPEIASEIDALILLSQWHANYTKAVYPFLKDAEVIDFDNNALTYNDCVANEHWYEDGKCMRLPKLAIIGNGIDTERFETITEEKIPNRFIWCSSPDRGLEQVLDLWPMLRKELPDATLKIFYGWDYYDHALGFPGYREFKEKIRMMVQQDGVEWCNRIGQVALAKEMMKADAILYPPPHDFRETYGITFLECQAANVICFYRQNGALGETVGDRGIPIPLDSSKETIVKLVSDTLHNKEVCDIIRQKGRAYAMGRAWKVQAEKFLSLYKRLEK